MAVGGGFSEEWAGVRTFAASWTNRSEAQDSYVQCSGRRGRTAWRIVSFYPIQLRDLAPFVDWQLRESQSAVTASEV